MALPTPPPNPDPMPYRPTPARRAAVAAVCIAAALAGSVPAAFAQPAVQPSREPPSVPAPAILLANVYAGQVDPALYLVSEKLDGARAIWDGVTLRFRSGRRVPAPVWFTARLPSQMPLDGELYLGRGRFDALSAIVRREAPVDADWQRVSYRVFELPGAPGSFADRARRIELLVREVGWPQLQAVEQTPVADAAALRRRLDDVVAAGGEGLMLHLASAPYVTGRSDVLLKLKPFLDTEATVVAHRAGKGKYAGQLGALQVRMPDGRLFFIGTGFSDAQRREPPPVGSVVTHRYRDLTVTGLPRFASFLRVRDEP